MIKILPFNETFVKVEIDDYGIEQEFSEFFTFFTKGYKFSPAYKNGTWDGKIRLYNARTKTLYKGLIEIALKFSKMRNEQFHLDKSLSPLDFSINKEDFFDFCSNLKISTNGNEIDVRDYQIEAAWKGLYNFRSILICPTGSGKSLIIYMLLRYLLEKNLNDIKIILIVPTTSLVEQMFKDFVDYSTLNGWLPEDHVQLLYAGKDKLFTKNIMISTWQSLHAMKKSNKDQFNKITNLTSVAIFDEAHTYSATEVRSTIEEFKKTKRRIGTTGTLDGSKSNELVLTGLLGKPHTIKTTRQLIDEGVLSDIKIKIMKLKYPKDVREAMKGADYDTEMNFIIGTQARNEFIKNLVLKLDGASLITFFNVEKHGKILYNLIKENTDKNVYYVSGEIDIKERETIRNLAKTDPTCIIVASEKLFSTGINIPSLTNIITTVPRRSPILIRQTIGRGIRKSEGKDHMRLFDIVDDLSVGTKRNKALNMLDERMSIYIKEDFPFEIIDVDFNF